MESASLLAFNLLLNPAPVALVSVTADNFVLPISSRILRTLTPNAAIAPKCLDQCIYTARFRYSVTAQSRGLEAPAGRPAISQPVI